MTSWMTPIWRRASKLNHSGSNGAVTTIAGIEAPHMIRKGQFGTNGLSAFKLFALPAV